MAIGVSVYCDIHKGPMKCTEHSHQWYCLGFDGEGCDLYLSDEELAEILAGRPLPRVHQGWFCWTSERIGDPWHSIKITLYKELPRVLVPELDSEGKAEMLWQE